MTFPENASSPSWIREELEQEPSAKLRFRYGFTTTSKYSPPLRDHTFPSHLKNYVSSRRGKWVQLTAGPQWQKILFGKWHHALLKQRDTFFCRDCNEMLTKATLQLPNVSKQVCSWIINAGAGVLQQIDTQPDFLRVWNESAEPGPHIPEQQLKGPIGTWPGACMTTTNWGRVWGGLLLLMKSSLSVSSTSSWSQSMTTNLFFYCYGSFNEQMVIILCRWFFVFSHWWNSPPRDEHI